MQIRLKCKRIMDVTVSLVGLITLAPVLLIVSIFIYFQLGSPIVFEQDRVGERGKVFKLIKFRTMLNTQDADGKLLPVEERMTPFGNFIRSTSLDETLELFNVLKGDMSLVGPRPLLVEYVPLYSEEQFRRHDVKPGITGWAQINGRNNISWNEKFKLDVWYVDHFSLMLDVKILFMTLFKVIKRSDINPEGSVAMSKFVGNENTEVEQA
ncbi:sugar transferase [Bacillus sp. JJ664]